LARSGWPSPERVRLVHKRILRLKSGDGLNRMTLRMVSGLASESPKCSTLPSAMTLALECFDFLRCAILGPPRPQAVWSFIWRLMVSKPICV
jgi:hypothetical protein